MNRLAAEELMRASLGATRPFNRSPNLLLDVTPRSPVQPQYFDDLTPSPTLPPMPLPGEQSPDFLQEMQNNRREFANQLALGRAAKSADAKRTAIEQAGTAQSPFDPTAGAAAQALMEANLGEGYEPSQRQQLGDIASDMQRYAYGPGTGQSRQPLSQELVDLIASRQRGIDPASGMRPQQADMANVQGMDRPMTGAMPFNANVSRPGGIVALNEARNAPLAQEKPTTPEELASVLAESRAKGPPPRTASDAAIAANLPRSRALIAERKAGIQQAAANRNPMAGMVRDLSQGGGTGGGGLGERLALKMLGLEDDPRLAIAGMQGANQRDALAAQGANQRDALAAQIAAAGMQGANQRDALAAQIAASATEGKENRASQERIAGFRDDKSASDAAAGYAGAGFTTGTSRKLAEQATGGKNAGISPEYEAAARRAQANAGSPGKALDAIALELQRMPLEQARQLLADSGLTEHDVEEWAQQENLFEMQPTSNRRVDVFNRLFTGGDPIAPGGWFFGPRRESQSFFKARVPQP